VIASVAVGLLAGMFMMAFSLGLVKQEIDSAVSTQISHIQIHNPRFQDDKDVVFTIANGQALVDQLKKVPQVKAVTGRIITTGMIASSSTSAGVEIHGINPADEKTVSCISGDIKEGVYFNEDKKNEIVVGAKLAEKLGVRLHSKIVLTFQSKNGDLTSGSFRIAGIFKSRISVFDESTVFTRFTDLAQLLGTGDEIHEIALLAKDEKNIDALTINLQKKYPSLLVQSWLEISPEMAMLTGVFDQIMYIIIGIILMALMFGIINTMLMAVLERQREFGMLMAIGMNRTRVFFMVVLESILLTCAGIPIGFLLNIGAVAYFAKHGIDLSRFSDALVHYGFSNMVYPEFYPAMFAPITIMTAVAAILSSIYPAYKALQYKPAVAIHKI